MFSIELVTFVLAAAGRLRFLDFTDPSLATFPVEATLRSLFVILMDFNVSIGGPLDASLLTFKFFSPVVIFRTFRLDSEGVLIFSNLALFFFVLGLVRP